MDPNRRPLKSRSWPAMHSLAAALVRLGVSPNQVSIAGAVFGIAAGVCFAMTSLDASVASETQSPTLIGRALFIAAAAFIQLRLVCNLIDGMVAIEGGKQTRVGVLYNELPDRVSDAATLIGAGYAAMSEPVLGWLAALLAVMTAYIRAVGKAEGTGNDFCGPMAKPHRMAVMTFACVACACWPNAWFGVFPKHVVLWERTSNAAQKAPITSTLSILTIALSIVALGSAATCVRRTLRIARALESGTPNGK